MRKPEHSTTFHDIVQNAREEFKHENLWWKRRMIVERDLLPELTKDQTAEIHAILEKMTSLTATQGKDSKPFERRRFKMAYNRLVEQIKDISPEYYLTIKVQDE